MEKSYNIRN